MIARQLHKSDPTSGPVAYEGTGYLGRDPIARLNARYEAPEPATAHGIALDLNAAKDALDVQEADRPNVVLTGSDHDLMQADIEITRLKARIERCEARHAAALVREAEEKAEHDAEQKRRKALHKQATKASTEIARMADEYVEKARDLAELLRLIRQREHLIREANGSLPDGVDRVPPGEPDMGKLATDGREEIDVTHTYDGTDETGRKLYRRMETRRFIPGQPSIVHTPLSQRVRLPALGGADPIFAVNFDSTFIAGEKQ